MVKGRKEEKNESAHYKSYSTPNVLNKEMLRKELFTLVWGGQM